MLATLPTDIDFYIFIEQKLNSIPLILVTAQVSPRGICLNIHPGVGLLDHIIVLFLILGGYSILFSNNSVPIYLPTNSVQGFYFPHILANMSFGFYFYFLK